MWSAEHGAAFGDADVARLYALRRTYPAETFGILARGIDGKPRSVLDVGCGSGGIARHLAPLVDRIDAVDASAEMLAEGRLLPGGDDLRIRWIHSRAEDATLSPPYGLVVCGQSMHWLDRDVVLPRFADVLRPDAMLAIVDVHEDAAWTARTREITARYSVNTEFRKLDVVSELVRRGRFIPRGVERTSPVTVRQPRDAYIASYHAMSSLTTRRLGEERSAAFDTEMRAMLDGYGDDLTMQVTASVTWGLPS